MADPVDVRSFPPAVTVKGAARGNALVTAGFIILAIVVLYLGAGILVPLVLAVLLAFALAPLVRRLRRMHLPHILAVLIAVLTAGAIISGIGYVVATQMIRLASDLPQYQATVTEKAASLQASFGGDFITRLGDAVDQLRGQFGGGDATGVVPMPVTIANGGGGPLDIVQAVLGSLLGPLTTAAIVSVFLIFLLLEREDLRDRFLKLVSRGDLRTSTKVINEAADRVGRYLLVQFGVNLTYGAVFAAGLFFIGVPNAILWGMLAAIFRYIPFVGTLIAASIPFTLAFAVDPGWSMLISAVALFVTLELVVTNAIEPRLYGSSTGLSALAVLVAAMFWATLWGPIGLILSTPITVCLVVLGRYVPQLQFFETLLGSEPVLSPTERFYQRLVAGNTIEAVELAEDYVDEHDINGFYRAVALPALRLAEADLNTDATDVAHRRRIVDSLAEVMDDLDEDLPEKPAPADTAAVLCIGGRTELDGAAAILLGRVLGDKHAVKVLPAMSVRQESIGQLDLKGVSTVCLCYLGENTSSYLRFVARRLRRRSNTVKIIACVFNADMAVEEARLSSVDSVVHGLDEAVAEVERQTNNVTRLPGDAAMRPFDASELARLRELARSDGAMSDRLHQIAEAMSVPVAILDIPDPADETLPKPNGVAALAMEQGDILVVSDIRADERFAEDRVLLEDGTVFCASTPLFGPDGAIIGALSLLDQSPREFTDADREKLSLLALRLMMDEGAAPTGAGGTSTSRAVA